MPKSLFIDKPKLTSSPLFVSTEREAMEKSVTSALTHYKVKDRPTPPTELIAALQSKLHMFENELGFNTELVSNITHCTLSATYLTALLEITSEALNNIYLHAHASTVLMVVYLRDDTLQLEIIDNGIGMKQRKIHQLHSHGISRMREIACQLGGELLIASSLGKGTLLTLTTITEK
jgi:two-component system, NarL family, nitrate/nitrite sensor histidine kinase NarX